MIKPKERVIRTIVILLMLSASPLSVTHAFADIKDDQEDKMTQKKEFEAILTEKIVNDKLEVQHYALPDDISKDMQRRASFEGQISSWAYVNYNVYHSGIILFDGKASKIGENLWGISTNGILNLEERYFDLKLSGNPNNFQIMMNETTQGEDLSYRVIFSGIVGETGRNSAFVISFMNSGFKNPEIGQNIKFSHIEELVINSEKSILEDKHYTL